MSKKNGKVPISSKYLIVSTALKALSEIINSRVFENAEDIKLIDHWRTKWFSVYNYSCANLVVTTRSNQTSCLKFDPSSGDFDDEKEGLTTRIPIDSYWFEASVAELSSQLGRPVSGREFSAAFNFSLAYHIVRYALRSPKDVLDIGNSTIYVDPSDFPGFRNLALSLGDVTWIVTTTKPSVDLVSLNDTSCAMLGSLVRKVRASFISLLKENPSCKHPCDVEKEELYTVSSLPNPEDGKEGP